MGIITRLRSETEVKISENQEISLLKIEVHICGRIQS